MELLIVVFIIFWPVLAGALAMRRQRKMGFWIVMGILFGPFAVLVLAALPDGTYDNSVGKDR